MFCRFSEVAYIVSICRLDIRGIIDIEILSPKTEYIYLVFKLANRFNGLKSAKSSIRFVNYESEIYIENQVNIVHLIRLQGSGGIPNMRGDGWK